MAKNLLPPIVDLYVQMFRHDHFNHFAPINLGLMGLHKSMKRYMPKAYDAFVEKHGDPETFIKHPQMMTRSDYLAFKTFLRGDVKQEELRGMLQALKTDLQTHRDELQKRGKTLMDFVEKHKKGLGEDAQETLDGHLRYLRSSLKSESDFDLSNMEESRRPNMAVVELHPILRDLVDGWRGDFENPEISVNLKSKRGIRVLTDEQILMHRVFTNLFKNAADHRAGGPIDIEVEETPRLVKVHFTNMADPVPAETLDLLGKSKLALDPENPLRGTGALSAKLAAIVCAGNVTFKNHRVASKTRRLHYGFRATVTLPKHI